MESNIVLMFIFKMLCVKWGSTSTGWHISVHCVKNSAYTWSVILSLMETWEWGIYGLNGWDIYDLMVGETDLIGWGSYYKLSYCSLGKICSKINGLQGSTLPVIAWPQILVPLNSWHVAYYRDGGTTPNIRLILRSPALSWHSQCYEYKTKKTISGWGLMGEH